MLLTRASIGVALRNSLAKLSPREQFGNAETLGVYLGTILATLGGLTMAFTATPGGPRAALVLAIAAWLWLGVLSANFVEALAVEWTRARAAALQSMQGGARARRLCGSDRRDYRLVDAGALRRGDLVLVEPGDIIPADGTVIEGAASVSEGAVTGESAPVLRSAERDSSFVRGGSHVLSDWLVVRVRSREGFFDPIVTISEPARRRHSRQGIALSTLLTIATVAFLIGVVRLPNHAGSGPGGILVLSGLVALLVCSMPITARVSVFVLGLVSLSRLRGANIIATSGGALEAAADIDVLVLDKTGTITRGDRHAVAFHAAPGVSVRELRDVALLASFADESTEGRSIVALIRQIPEQPPRDLSGLAPTLHEFSAQTRISGIDLDGRRLRKGAADAMRRFVEQAGGSWSPALSDLVSQVARSGDTPLVVADGPRLLGVIELHDVAKGGIRDHCAQLRRMGIRTVMVTGDNSLTAAAIAAEVGVDEFQGEATPEKKRDLIRRFQEDGHQVAMCGDGTNDAPALAQANMAMAMNSGTQAAKDAGGLVDLDSDPTKFIGIVQAARQVQGLRRSLTAFSIAADLAKYLAIIPVVLAATWPALHVLNITRLTGAHNAILSAVIFNVLLIAPLLLLVARGARARAQPAARSSRRGVWLYGLAGMLLPWVGIRLIDVCLAAISHH